MQSRLKLDSMTTSHDARAFLSKRRTRRLERNHAEMARPSHWLWDRFVSAAMFSLLILVVHMAFSHITDAMGINSARRILYEPPHTAQLTDFVARSSQSQVYQSLSFDDSVSRDRGIVMPIQEKSLALGLSLIKELRCLGNTELIQLYHCLPTTLSEESRNILLNHDTRLEVIDVCLDIMTNRPALEMLGKSLADAWLKPLALIHTDIQEVLVLDPENFFLHDPAVIRTWSGYVSTGTTFFFDRLVPAAQHLTSIVLWNNKAVSYVNALIESFDYGAFNLSASQPSEQFLRSATRQGKTCHEQHASLVAVDKSRAGKALSVLWYLVTDERQRFEFSDGGKESYWIAYEIAHQSYSFSPWAAAAISSSTSRDLDKHPTTLCGSMAQFIPSTADVDSGLLYVSAKTLLENAPIQSNPRDVPLHLRYNVHPTHITPRRAHGDKVAEVGKGRSTSNLGVECISDGKPMALPASFNSLLLRRRAFMMAIETNVTSVLQHCPRF